VTVHSCDIGGDYFAVPGGGWVYRPRCEVPASHRYRSSTVVDEQWGHRCTQHAAWLDRTACTVEPLSAGVQS
jgi:hypothetical protein